MLSTLLVEILLADPNALTNSTSNINVLRAVILIPASTRLIFDNREATR